MEIVAEVELDVGRTVEANQESLFAVARHFSLCEEDAKDALQCSIEIYLRNAARLDRERSLRWLKTVIKHEALAIRNDRLRQLPVACPDLDQGALPTVEDKAIELEHVRTSLAALAQLKAHERKALLLKAEGYSYLQIGEITGWSYTKVNRCITEGRRRLRTLVASN